MSRTHVQNVRRPWFTQPSGLTNTPGLSQHLTGAMFFFLMFLFACRGVHGSGDIKTFLLTRNKSCYDPTYIARH